jgi:hypothetical protein
MLTPKSERLPRSTSKSAESIFLHSRRESQHHMFLENQHCDIQEMPLRIFLQLVENGSK